jgi:hypothetical protein
MRIRISRFWCTVALAAVVCGSCVFVSRAPQRIETSEAGDQVTAPCKAHLRSGEVIVFPHGVVVTDTEFSGQGELWDLSRKHHYVVARIHRDSVAFLEYYPKALELGPFVVGTIVASAVVGPPLAVAIFGSCPTVYSEQGDEKRLDAECFSYSIAPWGEKNDLDRLQGARLEDGTVAIIVRNEALETHYINALSLVTVDHPLRSEIFPTPLLGVAIFGRESRLLSAVDSRGRDVLDQISARDDRFFESDTGLIHDLSLHDTRDWLDITVDVPRGAKTMIVALRVRNTLMNTVFLYDVLLGGRGVHALDWMGSDIKSLWRALKLRNWYHPRFGLSVELPEGSAFREAAYIPDTGPIVWHETAVEVKAPRAGRQILRFSFLPGNWSVDWIGVSFEHGLKATVNSYEASAISGEKGDSLARLVRKDDKDYLITSPRDEYRFEFRPASGPTGMRRSYLLSSRGYYIEWLRHAWFAKSDLPAGRKIDVCDADLRLTAALWMKQKADYEKRFYASRLATAGGLQP